MSEQFWIGDRMRGEGKMGNGHREFPGTREMMSTVRRAALLLVAGSLFACGGGGGSGSGSSASGVTPQAASRAVVTEVGPNGAPSVAYDLNASSEVVGVSGETGGEDERAFWWQTGQARELSGRRARAVNDFGDAVGEAGGLAYLWSADGTPTALAYGAAHGINNAGQVVGEAAFDQGGLRAFLWQSDGIADLGTLGGGWSSAYAINDAGQVAGWAERGDGRIVAVRWEPGAVRELGTLGGPTSMAYGINEAGQVVGYSSTVSGDDRAFLFDPEDGMIALGTLGGYSVAYDVDNSARVVGESLTAGGRTHAFLWQDGRMVDLNELLPADSGWELTRALAINDQGEIAGEGMLQGKRRAFLLSALP
jgi:probable HAF family extracellular repeat protein